jgi:hypothetical protein
MYEGKHPFSKGGSARFADVIKKLSTWTTALTLSGALLAVGVPAASAQTYPTPCKKGEVRVSGKCIERVTNTHKKITVTVFDASFHKRKASVTLFRVNVGPRKGRLFYRVTRNGRKFHVYIRTRTQPRLVVEV